MGMGQYITKFDIFGADPVNKLHYGGKEKHKSFIGGLCTLLVILTFVSIFVSSAIPIFNKSYPKFKEKEIPIDINEKSYLFDGSLNTPNMFFYITDGV